MSIKFFSWDWILKYGSKLYRLHHFFSHKSAKTDKITGEWTIKPGRKADPICGRVNKRHKRLQRLQRHKAYKAMLNVTDFMGDSSVFIINIFSHFAFEPMTSKLVYLSSSKIKF